MFSAGCLWKLYVALALVTLASLPAVELANVERHTLSRRAEPKEYTNVRCGDSWAAQEDPPTNGQTACKGYDGHSYMCETSTCKYGLIADPPQAKFSLAGWRFTDCTRYPLAGEAGPAEHMTVSPIQFWAHNVKGEIVVRGWDESDKNKLTHVYKCHWKLRSDINNQRPVCHKCLRKEFKEAPEPTIPS